MAHVMMHSLAMCVTALKMSDVAALSVGSSCLQQQQQGVGVVQRCKQLHRDQPQRPKFASGQPL